MLPSCDSERAGGQPAHYRTGRVSTAPIEDRNTPACLSDAVVYRAPHDTPGARLEQASRARWGRRPHISVAVAQSRLRKPGLRSLRRSLTALAAPRPSRARNGRATTCGFLD